MPLVVPPWHRRRMVRRRRGRAPARAFVHAGGEVQSPFPASPLGIRVMLAIGADPTADPATWSWTDVSAYVLYQQGITITRGRRDEQTRSSASSCRLRLLNPDGIWSPRNVYGPYWGQLRRNTPLRVDVNPGTGWHTRFTGFVLEWAPTQDLSGNFRYVPVAAEGVLRRLEQGAAPLKSPVHRATMANAPVAYWPLEDDSGSGSAASAVGGPSMTVSGTVGFAGDSTLVGSQPLTAFAGDGAESLAVQGPDFTPDGLWAVSVWFRAPANVATDTFMQFVEWTVLGSTSVGWDITAYGTLTLNPGFQVTAMDSTSSTTIFLDAAGFIFVDPFDGDWHHLQVQAVQDGAGLLARLYVDGVLATTDSVAATLIGRPQSIAVRPRSIGLAAGVAVSVGHLSVHAAALNDITDAGAGYDGELAGDRFDRLAREEGVHRDVPLATSTEAMGPQAVDAFLDLQRAAELSDEGLIVERFDSRFGFDPRALRYNRDVTLTLDYTSRHIADVPDITDDDQLTRNDVTVERDGGSSARSVDDSGPMGTDGSTGVGRYDEAKTVSLHQDNQVSDHASWRRHLGTVDEQRFPQVKINLRRNPDLIQAWLQMDVGHRYVINNLPTLDLPPQPVDQLLEGYTERIDQLMWEAWLNGSPESGYEVFAIETGSDNRSRIAQGSIPGENLCTTDVDQTSTDVSIAVTSQAVRWVDSATYPNSFPMIIIIAGEVMTCTALTGTALSGQTMTVTRALYGTAKALPAGSPVQIWRPAAIAL